MFPTELAAESNTSNIRTQNPQKAPKGILVPEIKDRQYLQIIREGKAKWYEINVYASYGISCWIQHLETKDFTNLSTIIIDLDTF